MTPTQEKLYSAGEAAKLTGWTRDWLQQLCRARKLGTKVVIPGTTAYRYLISATEIAELTVARKHGIRLSCVRPE